MISRSRVLAVLLLSVVFSAHAEVDQARRGEILHMLKHDCGSCHGMTLKGGLGPALTVESLSDKPREYLEIVIRNGRPGTPMAPWGRFMSNKEVRWLVEQLKSGDVDYGND